MRKENNPIARILILSKLIVLLIFAGCTNDTGGADRKGAEKGFPPDFTATTIDGEEITLSNFRGNKAVLVDMWATWCDPCKKEMPELQEIYEKYSDDLEILAVSTDKASDIGAVRNYIETNKFTFKVIHDTTQEIARKYPSPGIPYLVVIDKEGKQVKAYIGLQEKLTEKIEKLLGL